MTYVYIYVHIVHCVYNAIYIYISDHIDHLYKYI